MIQPRLVPPRVLLGLALAAAVSLASEHRHAMAQERENPLEGQPAVRKRLLLVKHRLEVTAATESTVNADYKHNIAGGVRLEYHLSDMWSVGATGFYGVSVNTYLANRIINTLPDSPIANDPTPTKQQYAQHHNTMPIHGAAYASFTPWYGKLAAFGAAFLNFDFYFSGGLSFASLRNSCSPAVCNDPAPGVTDPARGLQPDNNPNNDPPLNDGNRIGLYLGGGIHVFVTHYLALDFTVRDYIFRDNPSGLDVFADKAVTDRDQRLQSHLFMGLGLSFFLPPHAKRTP